MSLIRTLRRISVAAGLLGVVVAALIGCGGGSSTPAPGGNNNGGNTGTGPGLTDPPDTNRAACTANAHATNRARWTVLVYINAANNLQPDSLLNVSQMAAVGSDANVNIVIQWKQA